MMEWSAPPPALELGGGRIHVWRVSLALGRDRLGRAWELLAPEERRRALRMRFPVHRARSVASRAALRILLGRYLDVAPEEVPIVVEPSGRPVLEGARPRLRFSVSHAGPLALYAFAADRAVGIDVERLRREVPFERLAARFFAAAEVEALGALPPGVVPAAFFACWTRKEALFKAWGGEGGLVPALKRFTVGVAPREPSVSVTLGGEPKPSERWELATLDAGPGFAAALAIEIPAAPTCFRFDWPA
jgi:4'-phosphopantetheinyl transferase